MQNKKIELDTNNHSVFNLNYHLLLCVKYRRKIVNDEISERLKEIFEYIATKYNIILEDYKHDIDYVHLLFRNSVNTKIYKFINAYKSTNSKLLYISYYKL